MGNVFIDDMEGMHRVLLDNFSRGRLGEGEDASSTIKSFRLFCQAVFAYASKNNQEDLMEASRHKDWYWSIKEREFSDDYGPSVEWALKPEQIISRIAQIKIEHETSESIKNIEHLFRNMLQKAIGSRLVTSDYKQTRIYLAYYLGDGVSLGSNKISPFCYGYDEDQKVFPCEFVLGISNPMAEFAEERWLEGSPVPGYRDGKPLSVCADVFQSGHLLNLENASEPPIGVENFDVRGELSLKSFPIKCFMTEGMASVGVLTISSAAPKIGENLRVASALSTLVTVLQAHLTFFAMLKKRAYDRRGRNLHVDGVPIGLFGDASSKAFQCRVVQLRRDLAGHFEARFLSSPKQGLSDHVLKDGVLYWKGMFGSCV